MKIIILLLVLLMASPAWAGPEMLLMAAKPVPQDIYTFTSNNCTTTPNTCTGWTYDTFIVAWRDYALAIETNVHGSTTISNTTLSYATGPVYIEYWKTCNGGCAASTLTVNGTTLTMPTENTWSSSYVYLTGGTGLSFVYTADDVNDGIRIRRVTVPKP